MHILHTHAHYMYLSQTHTLYAHIPDTYMLYAHITHAVHPLHAHTFSADSWICAEPQLEQ